MKNTKKVLSVVLAVVMALSAMSLIAFAAEVTQNSTEVDGAVNVKLDIVQVASATDTDSGAEYVATNGEVYAVTIYAKTPANYGLRTLRVGVRYDASKFVPMMSYDGDTLMCGQDYYDDTGESQSLFMQLPERFSDSKFYDADGNIVTKAGDAVTVGLGKSAAGASTYKCEYTEAGTWAETGDQQVMFCEIDRDGMKPKGAFFNTVNGLLSSDWLDVMTLYFKRTAGEIESFNSYFGVNVAETGANCVAGTITNSNGAAGFATGMKNSTPNINFVANAVETAIKPLVALTAAEGAKQQQIMFFLAEGATKTYEVADIDKIDYRFIAQFSKTAFPIDYNADGSVNDTDIEEVGFTMARAGEATEAQLTAFDAAGIAALSKDSGTIRKCWTAKISTDMAGDTAFAFSCRIKGIAVTGGTVASEYIVVPYVLINGTVYYGSAMTSTAQNRFNAYADTFLAKKNAA